MILLIGPPSVGKTLLLKRLQSSNPTQVKDDSVATIPTVGTNLMTVTLKKAEVTVREMGGAMSPIWPNYYKESHAVMFMIDLSRNVQVAISCVQFMTMLSHPSTQNEAVLLLLNKTDIPNGMSATELECFFRFDETLKHATQKISILKVSAKTGHNLDKVAKWIHEQNKFDESSST